MSKNNNSVPDFAARFAAASTQSLVEEFNRQVGSNAWTSARAVHDQALIAELQVRGIDISAIYDGRNTDFNHHVCLYEVFKNETVDNNNASNKRKIKKT